MFSGCPSICVYVRARTDAFPDRLAVDLNFYLFTVVEKLTL